MGDEGERRQGSIVSVRSMGYGTAKDLTPRTPRPENRVHGEGSLGPLVWYRALKMHKFYRRNAEGAEKIGGDHAARFQFAA
jgi:hypothetical protein